MGDVCLALQVFDVRLEAPSCWEKKATRKAIGEAVSSVVTSSLEELNTYAAHGARLPPFSTPLLPPRRFVVPSSLLLRF